VPPLAGRLFADGDDQPGGANVAVLSEALWRRDFGADPGVVGKGLAIPTERGSRCKLTRR